MNLKISNVTRCVNCTTVSTRPRTKFINGLCSACINFMERKKINWKKRENILWKICDQIRSDKDRNYDVVVPVGGGKDSSYVAWMLKNKFKMRPLSVFCEPPLMTNIGWENLKNFEDSGFDVIKIFETKEFKKMNKITFIKEGLPQHNWLSSIYIAPLRIAKIFNIKMIMWGEEGESMYGGKDDYRDRFNVKFELFNIKLNNKPVSKFTKFNKKKDYFWSSISKKDYNEYNQILKCHWSFFENWDEDKHLKIAKKYMGLKYDKKKQENAINNHSHTDQKMFALHMYLAYLKFGFGRATTDTSIAIRENKLQRKKALEIVKKYDHIFPAKFLKEYCNYFEMSKSIFFKTIYNFVNKQIFYE
jgi:N-acetyl sugar amidotransferase